MVPMGGPVPYRMLLVMKLGLDAGITGPPAQGHHPTVGFDST